MNPGGKKYYLLLTVCTLLVINIFLLRLDWRNSQKFLTFAMLDVGQGDGLFIESPTGVQIMFDGGSPRKILSPLSRVISPFDKTIDALIITNPDADHIGGFADILNSYKVDYVFEPGTLNDSTIFQNLKSEIKRQEIPYILARRGMRLHIGAGAVIDILFPDRDVSFWDTNDGSIVARLTYGNTSILLTGDSTVATEKIILSQDSENVKSSILKVGHHGSRTSTSDILVEAVAPKYALISSGKDNKYGHPHPEAMSTLNQYGANIFRTDLLGTIIMRSDGLKETFFFHK
jgi:competence protein ComEC